MADVQGGNSQLHSGIYERLVSDERDVLGQIAYSLYKNRKREFILRKQVRLGCATVPEDVVEDFVEDQTDSQLMLYKIQAEKLFREVLDASYGEQLRQETERIERKYQQQYEAFSKAIQPRSWWYGVWQSFAASFFFILAGYILLRMTGSWEALLSNR